jgi:poly(A) polymerase
MVSVSAALTRLNDIAESKPVKVLSTAFADAGFEFALVGGPVRDAMLGRKVKDLDFTTSATPEQIEMVIAPHAEATWDVGRAFGTIAARVAGEDVEITTYRADVYDDDSRKPHVAFGSSLHDDLMRRDFTINALALRLPELQLEDVGTGVEDLLAKRIRTPAAPEISFGDDPLRMLRAARFAAQLQFDVDAATQAAMHDMADRLEIVSAERIRDELNKLLGSEHPRNGIRLLVDTGLADRFLPELSVLRDTQDEHARHKDVYEHSLTVLDQAIELEHERASALTTTPDLVLRLAALLHDIGKPPTRRFDRGGVTFHHHDVVGAKLAKKRLRELRYDNDTIKSVARLIELHLRFFGYSDQAWSDSAVRRYVRDAGAELEQLHILTRADVTTQNSRKAERLAHAYDDIESRIAQLSQEEELNSVRPDLNGEQIMHILGIPAGPDVGRAYKYLLEVRLDEGPLDDQRARERLLAWAKENGTGNAAG